MSNNSNNNPSPPPPPPNKDSRPDFATAGGGIPPGQREDLFSTQRAQLVSDETRISGNYLRIVYIMRFKNDNEKPRKLIFDIPLTDIFDFNFMSSGQTFSNLMLGFKNAWVHIEGSPFHEQKEAYGDLK